LCKEFSLYRAV